MSDSASVAPPLRLLARSLMGRCPRCGSDDVFRRWFQMRRRCPACDLWFERNPGAFIGGIGVNTVVTFVLLLVTLVASFVWFGSDAGWPRLLVAPIVVAAIVPLAFFPASKMLWVAFELLVVPDREAAGDDDGNTATPTTGST